MVKNVHRCGQPRPCMFFNIHVLTSSSFTFNFRLPVWTNITSFTGSTLRTVPFLPREETFTTSPTFGSSGCPERTYLVKDFQNLEPTILTFNIITIKSYSIKAFLIDKWNELFRQEVPEGVCLKLSTEGIFLDAKEDSLLLSMAECWELVAAAFCLLLSAVVGCRCWIADARSCLTFLWRIERAIEAVSDITRIFLDLWLVACSIIFLLATNRFS